MHLSQLQGELGIRKDGVLLMGDNESSLKLATNPVFHKRSKHIRIKYHSLRVRVAEGSIELCKVDTGLNAADMFTKNVGVGVLKFVRAWQRWLKVARNVSSYTMLQGGGM